MFVEKTIPDVEVNIKSNGVHKIVIMYNTSRFNFWIRDETFTLTDAIKDMEQTRERVKSVIDRGIDKALEILSTGNYIK